MGSAAAHVAAVGVVYDQTPSTEQGAGKGAVGSIAPSAKSNPRNRRGSQGEEYVGVFSICKVKGLRFAGLFIAYDHIK